MIQGNMNDFKTKNGGFWKHLFIKERLETTCLCMDLGRFQVQEEKKKL